MNLEWPNGGFDSEPTEEKIEELVLGEEYVILSSGELTFIQTAKRTGPPWGHVLEYQDGAVVEHYRAPGKLMSFHRAARAMCKYLRGDESWRTDFRWEWVNLAVEP